MYTLAITSHRSFALKPLAAAILMVCTSDLLAAPSFNGSPENNVTVQTNGSTTTITQSVTPSNRALANWNDFSVPADEVVIFEQPNENSVILNRVLGNNPSEIFGRLSANGRVFLINPNGIVFGANSEVNVGGLIASTLTLKPDTQHGNDLIEFERTGTGGTISSNGTINAKDIAFISTKIHHNGILNASGAGAAVQLIAASEVTVNTGGTDLVLNVISGHDNAVINQLGEVFSQGGKIVLIARSQEGGQASVINTANLARASHIEIKGDVVRLTGSINLPDAGNKLQVTAQTIEQNSVLQVGGTVVLQADTLSLDDAGNDFVGVLDLNVSGNATIRDSNDLLLTGQAKTADIQAENTLSLGGVKVENGSFSADTIHLNKLNVQGAARLQASLITQTQTAETAGALTLAATDVSLVNAGNDFQGRLILEGVGTANIEDINQLQVSGQANALNVSAPEELIFAGTTKVNTLNANAAEINQTGALNVLGQSDWAANRVALQHADNDFIGQVNLQIAGSVQLNDTNNLNLSGEAQSLNAVASGALALQQFSAETVQANAAQIQLNQLVVSNSSSLTATGSIVQSAEVSLGGSSSLIAQNVLLDHSGNDFVGVLDLNVSGNTTVRDNNDLLLTGQAGTVDIQVDNTLTLGGVKVENGNFNADTIHLNKLNVQDAARLQASLITQTQTAETSGQLNLAANTVSLTDTGNDFQGQLLVNSATANVVDSNDLNMTFAGRNLTAQAMNLNVSEVRATGDVLVLAGNASIASSNDVSLQGQTGTLNVQARRLTQNGALQVRGSTRLSAGSVVLDHQSNDFQGEVVLNVAGNAVLNDQNALEISGQVQGDARFSAESMEQRNALLTDSGLWLKAREIKLSNSENSLGGALTKSSTGVSAHAVRLEGASQAVLTSQGNLNVQGVDVSSLNLTAQAVELGALGSLQNLSVVANEVRQSAAIRVEGSSSLTANHIDLRNTSNDFLGRVNIQARDATAARVALADSNFLSVQGGNLQFGAQVLGDLNLLADEVVLNSTVVQGATTVNVSGELTQNQLLVLNNATLAADKITLNHSGNRFDGLTRVQSGKLVELHSATDLNLDARKSAGDLALVVQGNASVLGDHINFANSSVNGHLNVTASNVSQTGNLLVQGNADFTAAGGIVNLQNANNGFSQTVSVNADQTNVSAQGDLRIKDLLTRGGAISAEGRLILQGQIEQTGGTLSFKANGIPRPLSSAEIALMLPPELDVFSAKEAVDPLTGLGRIALASAAIQQVSGQIVTTADSTTQFKSTQNGSVALAPVNQGRINQIKGQFVALAGQEYGQPFAYLQEQGASLFAVNNDVQLRVAGNGVESDVVAIRSRGLATEGGDSLIRARMPYNDTAAGTSGSYAGLTLSIPLGKPQQGSSNVASFGESSGVGLQAAAVGAIRVEVGELNRPGLGGFVTVLPFEGSSLLPGQVVYLAGPENRASYAFFYDGARDLNRIPVVYNGSLLLSPQENAALTTAQGAVVLARQEQTRSVVRTENVAGKIIHGVVAEVGPGRPATEGEGGAGKPDSCDAAGDGLSCSH